MGDNNQSEILAFITINEKRVLGGKALTLLLENADQQKKIATEIAKSLKADLVILSTGDYLVVKT